MRKYEVVSECYVPVGRGFRYKRAGQIVTLSDVDADSIADHIKAVDESEPEPAQEKPKRKRVAKRNTQSKVEEESTVVEQEPEAVEVVEAVEAVEPEAVEVVEAVEPEAVEVVEAVEPEAVESVVEEVTGEVTSDAGDQGSGDEGTDAAPE